MSSIEDGAFTFRDAGQILKILADAETAAFQQGIQPPKIVLIGGQAVNYWADRYRDREPALCAGPFTSKDVDFQASPATVDWVAKALGTPAKKPERDESTESSGLIFFRMADGSRCRIDFLKSSIPNT